MQSRGTIADVAFSAGDLRLLESWKVPPFVGKSIVLESRSNISTDITCNNTI